MVSEIHHEMQLARQARASGNEGKSRVCARRAAGWSAQIYLTSLGQSAIPTNALTALHVLAQLPNLPQPVRQSLSHLTQRVDEAYHLPPGVDLVQDAECLIQFLLEGMETNR